MSVVNNRQGWAVVRLVTVQKKKEMGRLLFATVTELDEERPLPTLMSGVDRFYLRGSEENLFFRRTLLSKEDAINWYRSLGEGERHTPVPTRKADQEDKYDGVPFRVPKLEDAQPWPALGLPIDSEPFSGPQQQTINPAPFIGSVPGRLHRRFGERTGLETLLKDEEAQAFVARRLHIDLYDYQEYLGSAVYIAPDPVIRQIDNFMVPAKDGRGERIIYRFIARPGKNLEGVRITTFDKEARLLTGFETHQVPTDGILEVEKGSCMGEYGFVVTHDDMKGVLAYKPSTPFVRQVNVSIRAHSGHSKRIRVPSGDSPNSPSIEYETATRSELASQSILGEVKNPGAGVRVAIEAGRREMEAEAKRYGQRWFPENSRRDAMHFVINLLRMARSRVMIADPYLGSLQLGQFLYALHGSEVNLTLLTAAIAFTPTKKETRRDLVESFKLSLEELHKHQQLTPKVRVISSSLHDRFLVLDDDVWFIGNSLNSLGDKASLIVRLPNPTEVIEQLQAFDSKGKSLDEYISSFT